MQENVDAYDEAQMGMDTVERASKISILDRGCWLTMRRKNERERGDKGRGRGHYIGTGRGRKHMSCHKTSQMMVLLFNTLYSLDT